MSPYNNLPFIFNCFHDKQHPMALKSIAKVPNQKVTRWPKCSSFFFFEEEEEEEEDEEEEEEEEEEEDSSSDGLVTLSQWFSHKTAAFSTEQCTGPSLFTSLKSHEAV